MNFRSHILIIVGITLFILLLPIAYLHAQLFGPCVKYRCNRPKNLIVAYLNAGTRKDIGVISANGDSVTIFTQTFLGDFSPTVQFAAGTNLTGIAGADFDGDGDTDLALTDQSQNLIKIYLNNTNAFFPGQTISSTQPYDIFTWYFDGGDTWDLFVANIASNAISYYEGLGDGTFNTSYESHYSPSPGKLILVPSIAAPLRIVAPSWNTDSASVLNWNLYGHVLFALTYYTHGLSRSGVGGQFFDDSFDHTDFALVCRSDSSIKMFEGLNEYEFQFDHSIVWPNFVPYEIAAADFDQDGDDDLASIDHGIPGKLWIGIHSGSNFLGSLLDDIGSGAYDIVAADMNNDTYPDLVVSFQLEDSIGIFFNRLGSPGCDYTVGDVNNSHSFNGVDVTYGVSYLKGGAAPPYSCDCPPHGTWYVSGDVNASCSYNGLDITYGVAYFKGGPAPHPCADCPPARR